MSTHCCGESCRKAWQDALWTVEGEDILPAAHATRRPTWRCERRQPIYEAMPSDADQTRAAFVQKGVGFELKDFVQCSNHACAECGRWMDVSDAKGSWRWRWACPD